MNNSKSTQPVAFITGASARIGAAIARRLHAGGYHVILHYRQSQAQAQALATELLSQRPDSVMLITGKLDDINDIRGIINDIRDKSNQFSGRLDLLVNNAAAFYSTPLATASTAQWDELVNTNLRAPFLLAQGLANTLAENHGCIINITDIYGTKPLTDYSVYSLTKAGLISLTQSLAKELAPDIRTNAISPGAILWPEREANDTAHHDKILKQVPLGRLGTVENISDTVWYLVNNDYINGQIINIDGGKLLS